MNKSILLLAMIFTALPAIFAAEPVVLSNDRVEARFDGITGAMIKLVYEDAGWQIMEREVLGQSFELLVPLPGLRYNVVRGTEQSLPVIERYPDRVIFTWSGMTTGHMTEVADITFRGTVRLLEDGLEYGGEIINNSPYPVEYVSWPCIGEISVPDKAQNFYHNNLSDTRYLFPRFFNQHGYWGVDYPTSTYELPQHSFLLVNNDRQGFMVYGPQRFPSNMLITQFELIPGFEIRDMNPYGDEMDGELVRIQFKVNQIIYNPGHRKDILDHVKFAPFTGTWFDALDIYKRDNPVAGRTKPQWTQEPLTWLKVAVGSAEELVRYASECSKLGVDVLQVRGWTREKNGAVTEIQGLPQAIRMCREMGVRIVLETNWTEVGMRSDAYKNHLKKYIMKDPFGLAYNHTYLCPSAPEVQRRALEQWASLPALKEADGFINMDNNHRNKTYLCFDPEHGHPVGEPTANGTMELDRKMVEALKAANRDIAAFGHGFLEAQAQFYDGYQVSVPEAHFPKHRYLHPEMTITRTADVRNARREINLALLNGFNVVYDLDFHNNRLTDYPHIHTYGRQIKELRGMYADGIWNAALSRPDGVKVEGSHLVSAVFTGKNGKRSVIVVNMDTGSANHASVSVDSARSLTYATPENPVERGFTGAVDIAPQSAVVIFEQ